MVVVVDLDALEKVITSEPKIILSIYDDLTKNVKNIIGEIGKPRSLAIVGCGDSYFSSIYGSYIVRRLTDIVAVSENPYEFSLYGSKHIDLLVVVSSSGRTRTTVDCAKWGRKHGIKVLAITCQKNSLLSENSDFTLHLPLRDEVPIPTVTSLGFLTAFSILALEIGYSTNSIPREKYDDLSRRLRATISSLICMVGHTYLETLDHIVDENRIGEREVIYFIGGGSNYVSALFAMAKFRELRISHSIAFELEEFLHYGSIPLSNDLAFIFVDKENLERGKDAASLLEIVGSRPIIVTNYLGSLDYTNVKTIDTPDIFSPIPTLILIHILALKTAKRKYGDKVVIHHSSEISRRIRY